MPPGPLNPSAAPTRAAQRDLGFSLAIVGIVTIFFVPLPPLLIDLGLAISVALSVLILMVAL